MSWIPSHLKVKDVSTLFMTRVPQFLSDVEKDHSLVLIVQRNALNTEFLSKIHLTDDTFYFYKDKYMSLPCNYTSVYTDSYLNEVGLDFFR